MADHLLQTLFVVGLVDGKIEPAEQAMIEALRQTVPQLKGSRAPQPISRQELLDRLALLDELLARRQCYVLAVEIAFASGTINDAERQFLAHIQEALRLDEDFARKTREIIGAKYRI